MAEKSSNVNWSEGIIDIISQTATPVHSPVHPLQQNDSGSSCPVFEISWFLWRIVVVVVAVSATQGDNQWRNTTYFIRNRPPASHFSIIYLGYLSIVCQNAKFPWDKTRHLLHPILQIRLPAILSYVLWFPGWGVFLEILRRDIVVHIIQQCVGAHYQCHRSLPWVQTLRTLNASPAAACNHLMILVLTSGPTSCQC